MPVTTTNKPNVVYKHIADTLYYLQVSFKKEKRTRSVGLVKECITIIELLFEEQPLFQTNMSLCIVDDVIVKVKYQQF